MSEATKSPAVNTNGVPAKDATALPLIERRIAELQQQRLAAQEQARQQDAAYLGAIQAMQQLREDILTTAGSDEEE